MFLWKNVSLEKKVVLLESFLRPSGCFCDRAWLSWILCGWMWAWKEAVAWKEAAWHADTRGSALGSGQCLIHCFPLALCAGTFRGHGAHHDTHFTSCSLQVLIYLGDFSKREVWWHYWGCLSGFLYCQLHTQVSQEAASLTGSCIDWQLPAGEGHCGVCYFWTFHLWPFLSSVSTCCLPPSLPLPIITISSTGTDVVFDLSHFSSPPLCFSHYWSSGPLLSFLSFTKWQAGLWPVGSVIVE